jgi:hypothetical protein
LVSLRRRLQGQLLIRFRRGGDGILDDRPRASAAPARPRAGPRLRDRLRRRREPAAPAFGGHFLSDVLLGGLIALWIVAVARRLLWPRGGP